MGKRGKAVLLAVLAVLALNAFATQAAQAEAVTSEWVLEGETLAEAKVSKEEIVFLKGSAPITFVFSEFQIACSKIEGSGNFIQGGTDEFSFSLSSCEITKFTKCKVAEPVKLSGSTALIATGGTYYYVVKPTGSIGITGEGCALSKENKVSGSVAAAVPPEERVEPPWSFSKETTEVVNKELKAEGEPELSLSVGAQAVKVTGEVLTPPSNHVARPRPVRRTPITALCKEAITSCGFAESYKFEAVITAEAEAKVKFVYGGKVDFCTPTLVGKTSAAVWFGAPLPGTLTNTEFNECNLTECNIFQLAAHKMFFVHTQDYKGDFVVREPAYTIFCGKETCEYARTGMNGKSLMTFEVEPGFTPVFAIGTQEMTKVVAGSSMGCPATAKLETAGAGGKMRYSVTSPGSPLYITR